MEPLSPALAGGFFTMEPAGKPFTRISSFNYHANPVREVIVISALWLKILGFDIVEGLVQAAQLVSCKTMN